MNHFRLNYPSNRRFAAIVLALSLVLAIQIAVYAQHMKNGAEVASYCAKSNAGKPLAIVGCIYGGCGALYGNDSVKMRACIANANRQLKE